MAAGVLRVGVKRRRRNGKKKKEADGQLPRRLLHQESETNRQRRFTVLADIRGIPFVSSEHPPQPVPKRCCLPRIPGILIFLGIPDVSSTTVKKNSLKLLNQREPIAICEKLGKTLLADM